MDVHVIYPGVFLSARMGKRVRSCMAQGIRRALGGMPEGEALDPMNPEHSCGTCAQPCAERMRFGSCPAHAIKEEG